MLRPLEKALVWGGEHPVASLCTFVGGLALIGCSVEAFPVHTESLRLAEFTVGSTFLLAGSIGTAYAMATGK